MRSEDCHGEIPTAVHSHPKLASFRADQRGDQAGLSMQSTAAFATNSQWNALWCDHTLVNGAQAYRHA